MKYGIREICDVVLKAKATQMVGNKKFYKGEPVIYFDSLKTSTMEGAATTVYAQGGRGNSRLIAWEGERTVTFTMEDALISTAGLLILTGAGLIEADENHTITVHCTETLDATNAKQVVVGADSVELTLKNIPSANANAAIYVMPMKNGNIISEPYLAVAKTEKKTEGEKEVVVNTNTVTISATTGYTPDLSYFTGAEAILVDYYTDKNSDAQQIEITPDKFGGNYYLEASTLFRDTNGTDMPAEFIIPNCKVQSNFTFTMASSGDPSTFTFTMDAFPDYTRFNPTKKVLSAIQIIADMDDDGDTDVRKATNHAYTGTEE